MAPSPYTKIERSKYSEDPSTFNTVFSAGNSFGSALGASAKSIVGGVVAANTTSTANGYKNNGKIAYNSHKVGGHTTDRSKW